MAFRELRTCVNLQYGSLHLAFTQWDRGRASELTKARLMAGLRQVKDAPPQQAQEFADSLFASLAGEGGLECCSTDAVDFNLFFLHFHKGEPTLSSSSPTTANTAAPPPPSPRASPPRRPIIPQQQQQRRSPSPSPPASRGGPRASSPSPAARISSPLVVVAASPQSPPVSRADRLKLKLMAASYEMPPCSSSSAASPPPVVPTVSPSDIRRGLHSVDLSMPHKELDRVAFVLLGSTSSSARQPTSVVLHRLKFLQEEGLYN